MSRKKNEWRSMCPRKNEGGVSDTSRVLSKGFSEKPMTRENKLSIGMMIAQHRPKCRRFQVLYTAMRRSWLS